MQHVEVVLSDGSVRSFRSPRSPYVKGGFLFLIDSFGELVGYHEGEWLSYEVKAGRSHAAG